MTKAVDVILPATDDPSYTSMESLLRHVLRAARDGRPYRTHDVPQILQRKWNCNPELIC